MDKINAFTSASSTAFNTSSATPYATSCATSCPTSCANFKKKNGGRTGSRRQALVPWVLFEGELAGTATRWPLRRRKKMKTKQSFIYGKKTTD